MTGLEIKFNSLFDAIFSNKNDNNRIDKFEKIVFIAGQTEQNHTYEKIKLLSLSKAKKLLSVTNKECVLIEGENTIDFLTNFFAVMLSQNIPVPVTTSLWINELRYIEVMSSIIETTEAKIFLGSESSKSQISSLGILHISNEEFDSLRASEKNIYLPNLDDIAFIQFSSGSTGNPKGVTLTHRNVLSNILQISKRIIDPNGTNTVVSWLPVHHDMGLIGGVLVPLYNKFPVIIMSPYEFAISPTKWLKTITKYGAEIIVAPNSGYHLATSRIKEKHLSSLKLETIRIALCGAEPIKGKTLQAFFDRFSKVGFKKNAFTPCYGMAENTLAISFHENQKSDVKTIRVSKNMLETKSVISIINKDPSNNSIDDNDTIELISCGTPLQNVSVKVLGNNDNILTEGHIGEIIVKSPSTTSGYYKRDDINKNLFFDGHLRTGDLGVIINGEIYITGRKKDLIIIGGININAEELESFATKIKDVRPGRLAAFSVNDEINHSERIHIIVEARKSLKFLMPINREKLKKDISSNLSKYFPIKDEDITIVAPGKISKTTSGKVQRAKMRHLYLNGDISRSNFTQDYLISQLKEIQVKSKILKTKITSGLKPSKRTS